MGVPFNDVDKKVLSNGQIAERTRARNILCQIAFPFLDGLYDFIKGSNFLVMLSDEEGYVLYSQGDPDISQRAARNKLVIGGYRSESYIGTNGIGTVLVTGRPLQVFGAEHYYDIHSDWVCSGAPIRLPDGSIGGVVCLSGMADKVSYHTLGMAVAAADAISRQLKLQIAYDTLELARQDLSIIIETVPTAICLLDKDLKIQAFNAQATKLLSARPEELQGTYFLNLIGRDVVKPQYLRGGLANRYITMERDGKKQQLSLSVQPTGRKEYVVQVEPVAEIHKRVNNIIGSDAHFSFSDIVGESPAIKEAVQMAMIAAQNNITVFLTGESGTGKELFAQAIHNASARKEDPFVAVNCGALPKSLIGAELFGYESGSFTGARREGCAGKFELANGGTIFLDEIGDMPFDVQVMLLRVLQNREISRIGSSKTIKIDVRIITATNQNLERLVAQHMFREDLYYRINVFHIRIPPLRERYGDVSILADFFLKKYAATLPGRAVNDFSDEARTMMERYPWSGNVRQLENAVERAVYLTKTPLVTPNSFPPEIRENLNLTEHTPHPEIGLSLPSAETANPSSQEHGNIPPGLSIRKNEKVQIEQALRQTGGNVKEASVLLEISRRTLYRKLDLYGIDCNLFRKA